MASEHSYNKIVYTVHSLIEKGDLIKLKKLLRDKTSEEKKTIVNEKFKNNTALFSSCFRGKLDIVRYLLDNCKPDLEATGTHIVEEDEHSEHIVPPIWSAAISNKLDIAKALIEKGASVHGCSDTKSTAVRAACYSNNVEMVRYLVEHGADVNIPNKNGATCLMNAIECKELCEFLIQSGSNVNAQETGRDRLTALHYAVNYQKLDTIKVLLQHGADVNLKTIDGISPVLLAALLNLEVITTFFTNNDDLPIPIEDKINATELLGAKAVDYSEYNEAKEWWNHGIQMREQHQIPKQLPDRKAIYGDAKEPETRYELSRHETTSLNMYLLAALVKERILGPLNQDSLLGAIQYGWELRGSGKFRKALNIILYCYNGYRVKEWYLLDNCLIAISQVLNLTALILKEEENEAKTDEHFNSMSDFLRKLVDHLMKATPVQKAKSSLRDEKRNYQQLMLLLLDCVSLLIHVVPDENSFEDISIVLKTVLKYDPRGLQRQTLLHMAVDTSTTKRLYESGGLSAIRDEAALVRTLLECGAQVNAGDTNQNSPLYCHIKVIGGIGVIHQRNILDLLLEHGAHVDMCNDVGETPLGISKHNFVTLHEVKHTKLQCLAANIINKFNIPFRFDIPVNLIRFVEMHGAQSNIKQVHM
ncbi:protein fem-1 homolog CG6966-like [Mizuhopecten yessoensis]|uniref:Protein fem-1-like C n=1 Tax=Mizuhopecten yessoensis TaxID=6573 RepID=A0A210QWR4_MIZYE|nr:protein fem-1 homolog CG6966-like [Mizuhopecten yessoensis]OWF53219.1 Protein fem-1-like C [Mizuhopecten yessoensis]